MRGVRCLGCLYRFACSAVCVRDNNSPSMTPGLDFIGVAHPPGGRPRDRGHKADLSAAEIRASDLSSLPLLVEHDDDAQVGVVTPYTAQVRLLRSLWKEACREVAGAPAKGGKKGEAAEGAAATTPALVAACADPRALEIASVDNFQGREKELILFSAVRSNVEGRVGFVADRRRLNVALTRARCGLVVFGDAGTLERGCPHWRAYWRWCQDNRVQMYEDELG